MKVQFFNSASHISSAYQSYLTRKKADFVVSSVFPISPLPLFFFLILCQTGGFPLCSPHCHHSQKSSCLGLPSAEIEVSHFCHCVLSSFGQRGRNGLSSWVPGHRLGRRPWQFFSASHRREGKQLLFFSRPDTSLSLSPLFYFVFLPSYSSPFES